MRTRAVLSHAAKAVAEGALIALLVVGLAAGTTFAGKPTSGSGGHKGGGGTTGGGTGSLALVLYADVNGNGQVNYLDTVTFTVSTTATTTPTVTLRCYQNGNMVLQSSAGFYPSYPWPDAQHMVLNSPAWSGGAASCTAVLNETGTTLSFPAGA